MSDKEFGGGDDLSLPKATVQKILVEILPPSSGLTTTKEFRDAFVDCCVEFIRMISTEANDISEKEAKKTIACEHIVAALKELDFPDYIAPVLESAEDYKKQQATRERKQSKMEQSGLTEEQLLAQQQALFASASSKFTSGPSD